MWRLQVQQLTLTVYIVFATSALIGEALLNCSQERAKNAHIFEELATTSASSQNSWTPTTSMSPPSPGSTRLPPPPSAHANANASDGATSTKSPSVRQKGPRLFIEPILDRKSTRLNSSHSDRSRMPSSA